MKRCVLLMLLVLLVILLPLCVLADGDPANVVVVGQTRLLKDVTRWLYEVSIENLTPDIISVQDHFVTGIRPGMGTIRCTWTKSGEPTITENLSVKVYAVPTGVSLSEASIKLGVNEHCFLTAILPEGTFGEVTFTTDNNSIEFNLTNNPLMVYMHANESCVGNVTVTTYNGFAATCQVEVVPGPNRVTISPTSLKLFMGQTYTMSSEFSGGYTREGVNYRSFDPSICTISRDGIVTPVRSGRSFVTAYTYNSQSADCSIVIYDEPDAIRFDGIPTRIGAGQYITFRPKDSMGNPLFLEISLSDPTVISYDESTIRALKEGTCTITASSGLLSASMDITVCPPPQSLAVSPSDVTMKEVETVQLTPILPEGTVSSITYSTSDYKVATVTADGMITALKPGTATIYAETYNHKYAQCQVTVVLSEITYTLSPESAEMGLYKTLQLRLTDVNGNNVPASWSSSSTQTATVDQNGLVTGKDTNYATITATVADGRTYSAQVKVIVIEEYITVTPSQMTLHVGQTGHYYVENDITTCYEYTAASSNPSVALVTLAQVSGASFEAVGEGTATLLITSKQGKTATLSITVLPRENVLVPGVGTSTDLGVGQKKNMDVRDIYGNRVPCSYTSSDTRTAKVNGKGDITGFFKYLGSGHAVITATARDGRTCTTSVRVYTAPAYLKLNTETLRIPAGDTFQLVPSVQMGSSAFEIAYSTTNKAVATVSAEGLITAKGPGKCTITARTYNGRTARVSMSVGTAPTSITLSPSHLTLGLGEVYTLSATLSPGATGLYFFYSDDPSIVMNYDSNGRVEGHNLGSAKVIAKTYNGMTDECVVTVVNAPESLSLACPLGVVGIKQSVQLSAGVNAGSHSAITYTSSNTNVATVSGSGVVTGVRAGSVTITARTYNGLSATVTLAVRKAPSSIKLNIKAAKLGVGEKMTLAATLSAGSDGAYMFSSSNTGIAAVDQSGQVTAVNPGKAVITVQTYNGKKTTCTVTVYPLPAFISVKSTNTIKPGRSFTLPVTYPRNTYSRVTYTSDAPGVATVNSSGKVAGVAPGTAVITVTAFGGAVAKCVVTVK